MIFFCSKLTLFKIAVTGTVNESTDYLPLKGSVDRETATPKMNDRNVDYEIMKMSTPDVLEVETFITQRPKNVVRL